MGNLSSSLKVIWLTIFGERNTCILNKRKLGNVFDFVLPTRNCTTGIAIVWRIDWYAERRLFLRLQLCIKEMHWNYTWLQLYSWSFDAFSSNSYNAWHLLIRCRWQSFRYFQLKLSKNILCTLSAYQSMHHIKQLV